MIKCELPTIRWGLGVETIAAYKLPPLNPLKAFEAAGRNLSLTAAASELRVTPAAVSRQVKLLEDVTGTLLFERNHRAIRLTPIGERYLREIIPAFEMIDQATAHVRAQRPREKLSIQAYTTFALRWLIPRLPEFRKLHPALEVQITASLKPVSFDTSTLDGVIMVGLGDWAGLESTRLLGIRMTPVCAPSLLAKLPQGEGLARFKGAVLLHSLARKQDWANWLAAAGGDVEDWQGGLSFESSSMCYQAAIEGIGVAMAQPEFVEEDIAHGRLVQPFDIVVEAEEAYYLAVPRALVEERKVRLFRKWVQTCV